MNALTKYKNIFKWISFGILVLVSTTTLLSMIGKVMFPGSSLADNIYGINGFLCVISIISACVYGLGIYVLKSDDTYGKHSKSKVNEGKINLRKIWPCILLVIFMGWTAVGCIQASMEAAAEAALRDEIKENDTERNKEIAAWTSGDRMENAADRAWNGCTNLKDGYFSFLFYAMVAVNVVMLGAKSDNLKKIILRILLVSSLILTLFAFLSLFNPTFLNGMVKYNRAIFNNSNHYGYYLCISSMLCVGLFIKEKNLYFKVISLLGFILTTFMLIVNNTFGAYLGVMIAIGLLFIFNIAQYILAQIKQSPLIKQSLMDVIKSSVIVIIFTAFSYIISGVDVKVGARADNTYYTRTALNINLFKNQNVSGDTEKENFATYNVVWISDEGRTTKEVGQTKSFVERNFVQLGNDIKTIFNFFDEENNEIKVNSSGESIEAVSGNKQNEEQAENKSGLSDAVSNTGSGRGEVWLTSLKLIKQRPVFGWGLENLLNEFYYQYGVNEGRTHNLILQLAGTTGVFGMLFYMIAIIAIFFKVMARYRNWGVIEYVAVPTFIAYMVSSMFGNSAFYTSPYFMIILGMMIATTLFKGKELAIEEHKENKDS